MSFYCQFIKPGQVVFDIGANRGAKTAQFLDCNPILVVAVEPQIEFIKKIQSMFQHDERVRTENCAIGAEEGVSTLYVSPQADTIATIEPKWMLNGRFSKYGWSSHSYPVPTHTLDYLFSIYGMPCFMKIDAEGSDAKIIKTMIVPVQSLCFEFVAEFDTDTYSAINHLRSIGNYEFNFTRGDHEHFDSVWYTGEEFIDLSFYNISKVDCWGMIWARLDNGKE